MHAPATRSSPGSAEPAGLALKLLALEQDDTAYQYGGRTVLVPESCAEIGADKTLDITQDGKMVFKLTRDTISPTSGLRS